MKLLVYGLPGSGKTTLAEKLSSILGWQHLNADKIRAEYNDWDFSEHGRIRQVHRMVLLSSQYDNSIIDFVCPYIDYRKHFDYTIFMDTIEYGRYDDTNKIFQRGDANIIINDFGYDINSIAQNIKMCYNNDKYYYTT